MMVGTPLLHEAHDRTLPGMPGLPHKRLESWMGGPSLESLAWVAALVGSEPRAITVEGHSKGVRMF